MYIKENDIIIKFINKENYKLIATISINNNMAKATAHFIEKWIDDYPMNKFTKEERIYDTCRMAGVYVYSGENDRLLKKVMPVLYDVLLYTNDFYSGVIEFSKERMDIALNMKRDCPSYTIFV